MNIHHVILRNCHRFGYFLLYMILLFAVENGRAVAQDKIELRTDKAHFNESYDPEVPVSGGAVVGIRLGHSDGYVDVNNIIFPSFPDGDVCVRVVTQDGRFSANNIYKATGSIKPGSTVRLAPVSLKYVDKLSSYKVNAFAINAFLSKNGQCLPNHAVHIPQLLSNLESPQSLTVFVNSGGRFSGMFIGENGPMVSCQNVVEGARIAYDTICTGDIPVSTSDVINISVVMDDGFGEDKIGFSLMLP